MKIYDKDIELWQATAETHEQQLRSCPPGKENEYILKRNAAFKILDRLKEYKELVESYPEAHPSTPEPFGG